MFREGRRREQAPERDEIRLGRSWPSRNGSRKLRKFHIFKGIESDILPDGSLDYSDDILRRFDFVVASVHGQFRMEREAQTQRLLRAVAQPICHYLRPHDRPPTPARNATDTLQFRRLIGKRSL